MDKPNSQSVTSTHCTCGYLERGANDPHSPIIFNDSVNEYHFEHKFHGRDAQLMIYHCPWCGGVASNSHRASLFHDIDQEICTAMVNRTNSCVTLDDVIAILGNPDRDEFTKIKYNEKLDVAPHTDRVRRITFQQLSDEMTVSFTQQIDGAICPSFIPKPITMTR